MYDQPLDQIRFKQKLSCRQEIIDTDTGEVLYSVNSSVLFLSINFFCMILRKYFNILRTHRNIQLQIRTYQNSIEQDIPLDYF